MKDGNSFSLCIEEVFYCHGLFVTGRIESGRIKICDKLKISGNNTEMTNLCASLQKYSPDKKAKKPVDTAQEGDYVCIGLLQGSKLQIRKGMKLTDLIDIPQ